MLKPTDKPHREVLDSTPIARPTALRIPSQSEKIMAYVRLEQMRAQQEREVETFEEADDFELDDGEEWFSPFEEIFEAQPEAHPATVPSAPDPAPAPAPAPAPDAGTSPAAAVTAS